MMVPQLQSVLIFVRDLDRAIFFYCGTLGFPMRVRWAGGVEVGAAGTSLTLAVAEDDAPVSLAGRPTGMTFAVDRATYEALAAREVFAAEPVTYPWGPFAVIADPDGNEFAITAPAADDDTDDVSPRLLAQPAPVAGNPPLPELTV